MATSRFQSINDIVNHVAVEVGMTKVVDVFSSADPAFVQLTTLLTTCVQELMEMYDWQILTRSYSYTTGVGETGDLALPSDFDAMIPQTGWERSENVPLIGPLSAQDWTYLLGRDLVGSTIYASFRLDQNQFRIFPNDPMPAGLNINFEYTSRNLIQIAAAPTTYTDTATTGADVVMFSPHMIRSMLKMKFLEAKGFDSMKASDSFWAAFQANTGKDNSAPILTAGGFRGMVPYLDAYRNIGDSGYGR